MKGNHWRQHQGFSLPQVWGQTPWPGSAGQQVWKTKSCFVRMKLGEHQSTSSAQRNSWNDVHETITCFSLYCTCRRLADLYWIANGFHFLPVFCWHCAYKSAQRSGLPSAFTCAIMKWKTAGDVKVGDSRSWCGYCYWVECTWNISACDISNSIQGDSDGQNFQGLRGIVWLWLDFAFSFFLNLHIWICFN